MFNDFPQSELQIVAPDGTVRGTTRGIVTANQITIADKNAVVFTGDELRRKLPNGVEEAFEVLDPVFYESFHGIQAHYQIKTRRKGVFPPGAGGNFTFHVSGPNARVNIGSHDQSQNIIADQSVFGDLKTAIRSGVGDPQEQSRLISLVDNMEAATENKTSFLSAYQAFIASAASHMSIIAPLLPALTKFIG